MRMTMNSQSMRPRPGSRRISHRRAGVTLLEVVLSIGLSVMLIGLVFGFYGSVVRDRTQALKDTQRLQQARVVLAQMAHEIRQSSAFTPYYGAGLVGGRDWIQVFTTRLPRRILSEDRSRFLKPIPAEFDLMEVRYYIARHEDIEDEEGFPLALGMVRKETRLIGKGKLVGSVHGRNRPGDGIDDGLSDETDDERERLGPDSDVGLTEEDQLSDEPLKEELYAPDIKFLKFHYFDGNQWWPDWRLSGANSMPQVVRITIGFEPRPYYGDDEEEEIDLFLENPEEQDPLPLDQYTTFVRLLEADQFFGSRLTRTAASMSQMQEKAQGF